ncbi:MAG: hypothetical protein M3461_09115 [Pseudomonadota bacterium]|nr:hypothetical protein [Pseudomonadota bacterium]
MSDIFVLLFGDLILAIALRAVAGGVSRFTPLPKRSALAVVVMGVVALLAAVFWLVGRWCRERG